MESARIHAPLGVKQALRHLARALRAKATWRALWAKLGHDRVWMRSSALAFDTLLSIVPMTAVIMGAIRALGGSGRTDAILRYLVDQYVPAAAGGAIDRLLPLVDRLDLRAVGLFGLVALLPVIYALLESVESALADIFGAPRRDHWWMLLSLGALLTLAPLSSLLTVRYVRWQALAFDHVVTPLLVFSLLLYGIFRSLPSVSIRARAAMAGALVAGVALSVAKAGFGLYATHLATSIHLVWGAVAFVPLMLVWVLLSWFIVLVGAALAATLERVLDGVERLRAQGARRPPRRPRRLRRRLERRLRLAHSLREAS